MPDPGDTLILPTDDGPSVDPLLGQVIDQRYHVLSQLGAGGMGAVYVAEHVLTGRRLAIKTLLPDYGANQEAVLRFQREARAAARVGNEHIVDVTDMGQLPDGAPYMVLELLEGASLRATLARQGPLRISRAVHVGLQCCSALGAAHVKGILHRDVKPDNIFLLTGRAVPDFVKVLDFGISKIRHGDSSVESFSTSAGIIMGTLHYMSPEQIEGSAVDHRADVYALGAVLYEMLSGHPPFDAPSIPAFAVKVTTAPVAPLELERPSVPGALARIVERALAKRPDDRFATMEALADAIRPYRAYDDPLGGVVATGPVPPSADPAGGAPASRPLPGATGDDIAAAPGAAHTPHRLPTSTVSPTARTIRRPRDVVTPRRRWLAAAVALPLAATAAASWSLLPRGAPDPGEASRTASSAGERSAGPPAATVAAESPPTVPPDLAPEPLPAPSTAPAPRDVAAHPDVAGQRPPTPVPDLRRSGHSAAGTRNLLLRNLRRAAVTVTVTCDGRTTRATVPAFESRSVRVATTDCSVRCASALGLARCPLTLPASRSAVEVR